MTKIFNLSEADVEELRNHYVRCLVIYDIVSQKRRVKFCNLVSGYGQRVQKSCFECNLKRNAFHSFLVDISEFYDEEENDNIIIYQIRHKEVTRFNNLKMDNDTKQLIFY